MPHLEYRPAGARPQAGEDGVGLLLLAAACLAWAGLVGGWLSGRPVWLLGGVVLFVTLSTIVFVAGLFWLVRASEEPRHDRAGLVGYYLAGFGVLASTLALLPLFAFCLP